MDAPTDAAAEKDGPGGSLAAAHEPESVAKVLKERLYVSIVALSILLAIGEHGDHIEVGPTAAAMTIGVVASVLAAVLAEVIAHVAAHRTVPTAAESVHMVKSASWALLVIVIPLAAFSLAGLEVIDPDDAMLIAVWAIVLSFGYITYLAIRRSTLSVLGKVALLALSVAFASVVVELQVLAHG